MKRLIMVCVILFLVVAPAWAVLTKAPGATSQSVYVVIQDNFGDPNAAVVVTTLDMYYVIERAAISAKIDCTALGAADSAYASGGAFHVGKGVVRIDVPDAALVAAAGSTVQFVVESSGNRPAYREVQLSPAVNATHVIGTALTEAGGAGRLAASVSTWGNVATPAATAATVNQTGDSYARLGAPAGASVSADIGSMRLQAGTVGTAGTAATFTLSSGFPAVANAYPRGTILTFTDATTGQSYAGQIRTYTAGRVVTMYQPLPAAPELGDAVIVWPFIWTPVGF